MKGKFSFLVMQKQSGNRTIHLSTNSFADSLKAQLPMKLHISKIEHMEGLFCSFGKSKCITEEKGCICGDCEVYKGNHLTNSYYCLVENGK
ncbi:MAG: DUF2769 domain-containing protein [Methanosarcina sp.]|nr:MAG: DUF2769 domain-containing protein [Methanosarcina sp.]